MKTQSLFRTYYEVQICKFLLKQYSALMQATTSLLKLVTIYKVLL